jgi:hypothetical protein
MTAGLERKLSLRHHEVIGEGHVTGEDAERGGSLMTRIVVTSKVGPDGVLHLTLPLEAADANREVQITVEPVGSPTMSQEEWRQFILRMGGSIPDPTFRRHEQGEYEVRDPLP